MTAQVLYMPSGQVARKLGISPRTLGKITGNLYAQMSDGTKEDIGLFVKHGSKGLCVPDYVQAKVIQHDNAEMCHSSLDAGLLSSDIFMASVPAYPSFPEIWGSTFTGHGMLLVIVGCSS
jgi:hypothetical protein